MKEELIINTHIIEDYKIYSLLEKLSYVPVIEDIDFTIILRKEISQYGANGSKIKTFYTHNDEVYVEKLFTYSDTGVWVTINWFINKKEDKEVIGMSKVLFKPLSSTEVYNLKSKNRSRTINYLQVCAIGTAIENNVNDLLKHYKEEISTFLFSNTQDFKEALLNETDEIYLGYLNTVIAEESVEYPQGKKVIESILEQIV